MPEPVEGQAQPQRSPIEGAGNKIKEAVAKELSSKIEAQLKVVITASKTLTAEKNKLKSIVEEAGEEKNTLTTLLADLAQ